MSGFWIDGFALMMSCTPTPYWLAISTRLWAGWTVCWRSLRSAGGRSGRPPSWMAWMVMQCFPVIWRQSPILGAANSARTLGFTPAGAVAARAGAAAVS